MLTTEMGRTAKAYRMRETALVNEHFKRLDSLGQQLTNQYVLRVSDLPDDERPREKIVATGPQSLNLAELLAVLWGVGTRKEEVMTMAKRALREYGESAIAHAADAQQLAAAADIPLSKACQVVAAFELGRRFHARSAGRPVQVRNMHQAFEYLREMGNSPKEQLRGLYLDSRYQVVHDEVISVGTLTSSIVHPREVFQPAVTRNAVAVIVAHNHPSDILEPTAADIAVTRQLREAGQILGIDLLDHVIIGSKECISIMEAIGNE